MNFNSFADWLLLGLLTIFVIVLWWFLTSLIEEVKAMRHEMSNLNEKLAKVVTNQDWHDKELTRLDSRLSRLEDNVNKEGK